MGSQERTTRLMSAITGSWRPPVPLIEDWRQISHLLGRSCDQVSQHEHSREDEGACDRPDGKAADFKFIKRLQFVCLAELLC